MYFLIVGLLALLPSACQKKFHIAFDEKQLSIEGGRLFYRGTPLNGTVTREFAGVNTRQVTPYQDGLEHGTQKSWAENGTLTEQREFRKGTKWGTHQGWFPDGKNRFLAEFKDGHYVGEFWSWHSNGKVAEFKKFDDQGRVLVYKHWRESGQIYSNQVFAENFEQGIPGVKLCNTVKDTVAGR